MGKHRRVFSEPKYEINLEAKDKVLIRQERKSPLGQLLKKIALVTTLVLAALWLGGLIFNFFSLSFYPTRLILPVTHHDNNELLSSEELQAINIYVDGKSNPVRTRVTDNGVVFLFSKRGRHIIGIENTASRYDSLTFAKERALLDSLGLFKQKDVTQKSLENFVFHRLLSAEALPSTRFLSFLTRQPQTETAPVVLSFANKSLIILADATCGKNLAGSSQLAHDFLGGMYKNLIKFSPHVEKLALIKNLSLPFFNALNWYSENVRNHRFQYADKMNRQLRSSIFCLPYLYKDQKGAVLANLVLAFADIGDITFDPIEIRNIPLGDVETVPADAGAFAIVQAYLSMYDSFIYAGSLDASMINAFIQICSDTPNADPVARLGNRVMRSTPAPKTSSIVYTLDEFFAKIEKMDCLALYEELSDFWTNDPYQLQAISEYDMQEKEVVRAIIKWSLALKENEHECAENDWPTNEQRLSFFTTIKGVIDKTRALSWLQGDALYGVLIIEINQLQNS